MKTCIAILVAAFAFCTAVANPRRVRARCPACNGERSLSLTPPNLGQHDGELGVTPGKPFTSHKWDVRHDRCPLCDGRGVHEMWQLDVDPPADANGKEVCTKCKWSGIERCRRCNGTGIAQCPDCRKNGKGGVPGWLVGGSPGRRTSKTRKMVVIACSTCGGLGKIECTFCEGMGGEYCKRCAGKGFKEKKAARGS